jgi:HK97 family phage prohead protease
MSEILIRKRVLFVLDAKAMAGKPKGYIEGYASTFGNTDQGGDIMNEKCFDKTIAQHKSAGTMPHMFFNHNSNEPVGDWEDMSTDGNGLKVKGQLWAGEGIAKADQCYMMMKGKGPKGLSIGFIPGDVKYDKANGTREIMDTDLKEISNVAFPMNTSATAAVKALAETLSVRDAEEYLRDVGLSHSEAKAFIAKLKTAMDLERDALIQKSQEDFETLQKQLNLSDVFKTNIRKG